MEKENYTAYDLEKEEPRDPQSSEIPKKQKDSGDGADKGNAGESGESGENGESGDDRDSGSADHTKNTDDANDTKDNKDSEDSEIPGQSISPAQKEIEEMIREQGAERVLEIIRGNRNAAVDQILKEMDDDDNVAIHSGTSVSGRCQSIFDLASLA